MKTCFDCGKPLKKNTSTRCPKCSRAAQLPPVEDRFWSKVKIGSPTECWEWQAGYFRKYAYGKPYFYGSFTVNNKLLHAHRFSWELANNRPIPKGLSVCHSCDNPKCVNPNHLFLGTPTDNMRDMARKGRTGIRLGEDNNLSKLTPKQVNEIRNRYIPRKVSQRMLAQEYGVTQAAIWYVLHHRNWK